MDEPFLLSLSSDTSELVSSLFIPGGLPSFVNPDPINRCEECRNVLTNPMQLFCGHLVCEGCLDAVFAGQQEIICKYEDCGNRISRKEVFSDNYRKREIQNLGVFCIFKVYGCEAVVAWKNLQSHAERCEFARVQCLRVAEGCHRLLSRSEYDAHVTKECDYLPVTCDNCHQYTTKGKFDDHISKNCPQVLIDCPHGCGVERFLRRLIEKHVETCPNKPLLCAFITVGCKFQGSKEDVDHHEKHDISHHVYLISEYTAKMEQQNKANLDQIQEYLEEKKIFSLQIKEMEEKITQIQKDVAATKRTESNLLAMFAGQVEKVDTLQKKIDDKAPKNLMEDHTTALDTAKDRHQNLLTRVNNTEREETTLRGRENISPAEVAPKLKQLEKQYTLHNVTLAELDLRYKILETANYDGVLMWKLCDYKRRRQDAISGKSVSLFSQPFYTGRHGYKMCGRVYLNGDGGAKGTHLSLFFVLMKGDYDALLPWPFKKEISLILKDQNTRKNDLCEVFTSDVRSNSFQKPRTEMNVATGVPKFVTIKELETPTYLQDDTIILMMKVKPVP